MGDPFGERLTDMNRNDLPEVFFNRLLHQSEFQRKRHWRVELSDAHSEPMCRNDLPEVFFNRVRQGLTEARMTIVTILSLPRSEVSELVIRDGVRLRIDCRENMYEGA